MNRHFRIHLLSLGIVLSAALSLVGLGGNAFAAVDNDPDCDNVAIIRCGVFDSSQLRGRATPNEIRRTFDHMGISLDELNGPFVNGTVWRDGRVTVDGKTVATNAFTAARNMNGAPIPGTTNIGTMSVSRFADEGQTAFIKMKPNGTFDFAVIKSCGNPVVATPKAPPVRPVQPPQPTQPTTVVQPRQLQVCNLFSGQIETITESSFDEGTHTRDLSRCQRIPIQVCNLFSGEIETINENDFDEGTHTRDLSRCQSNQIQVCDLSSGEIITINDNDFDEGAHSRDLTECTAPAPTTPTPAVSVKTTPTTTVQVCDLTTNSIVTLNQANYDTTRYSSNLSDCVATTPMIAATGPTTLISGLVGSSALGYGAYALTSSRRSLLNKHLSQ